MERFGEDITEGAALPGTCQPGDWFYLTTGTIGLYRGQAVNTWVLYDTVPATAGGGAAWGGITGTLSAQTDLQTALDGKQAAGSYATGTGTANGTNTGDQTTVSGNAGTATTLQTPRTINGTSFNGSANITLGNGSVTLAQMADVATATVFYRKTAATGVPEVQTLATLKTDLGLTGTNSGDQTITLTGGVTGTGTGSFAATVITNANLTGDITSAGNATTIGAAKVTEAMQVLADNTTQDVSTAKHGYVPKAPNDAAKYLNGVGAWATPTGGSGNTAYAPGSFTVATGNFSLFSKRLHLTTTQRATVQGTARLRMLN